MTSWLDINLVTTQLALILVITTAVLAAALVGSVHKRKALVHELDNAKADLISRVEKEWRSDKPATNEEQPRVPLNPFSEQPRVPAHTFSWALGQISNNPGLRATREFEDYMRIAGYLPPWLRELGPPRKRRDNWFEYARGNILVATAGSGLALIGLLLVMTHLLLFSAIGILAVIVGIQIIYAAARDAGLFTATYPPPIATQLTPASPVPLPTAPAAFYPQAQPSSSSQLEEGLPYMQRDNR
jgi:hypothetical protein